MRFEILDVVTRTSKTGKTYCQAACKGRNKIGEPYLFVGTVPPELFDRIGDEVDLTVIFGSGSAYVLPY